MINSWKQLKRVFRSQSGIHLLQLGTGQRDRLCVPPVAPLTIGWLGEEVGWFYDSGFWFEKHSPEDSQVIVWVWVFFVWLGFFAFEVQCS